MLVNIQYMDSMGSNSAAFHVVTKTSAFLQNSLPFIKLESQGTGLRTTCVVFFFLRVQLGHQFPIVGDWTSPLSFNDVTLKKSTAVWKILVKLEEFPNMLEWKEKISLKPQPSFTVFFFRFFEPLGYNWSDLGVQQAIGSKWNLYQNMIREYHSAHTR